MLMDSGVSKNEKYPSDYKSDEEKYLFNACAASTTLQSDKYEWPTEKLIKNLKAQKKEFPPTGKQEDNDCCKVCVSYSHRNCKNREMDIQDVKEWIKKVDMMIEEGTFSISKTEREAKGYLSDVEKIIAAQKMKGKVFTDIKKKVNSEKVKVIFALSDRIVVLSKLLATLHDCLHILENVQHSASASIVARHELFSFAEVHFDASCTVLLKDIPELKMSIQEHKVFKKFSGPRFDVSIKYKKPEVSEYFSQCNDTSSRLSLHLFNKPMAQIAREPLITCNISYVASAERSNIQAGDWTPDGTYLLDNTILLCDTLNKQLIKLDENLCFLGKLPVAENPNDVCVCSDGNCVHVICGTNKVVSYTLQGPWREVQRFGTEDGAKGIACHGDRIIIGHWKCVVIYDSAGTEVSRINTAGMSYHPALSHNGRMLYHEDGDNVVCRSMEDVTREVWRYSSRELHLPHGIDTDRDGNTLIVGVGSFNVHQISGDGKINRIHVNKMNYMGLTWGLFTNRNNNTFCVISLVDKLCVVMYRFND